MWTGVVGRAYGVLGLRTSAFGVAGWREDARAWMECTDVHPGEVGILIGAGGAMVATYLVRECLNIIMRLRFGRTNAPVGDSPTQIIVHGEYRDFRGAHGEWHFKSDGPVEVVAPEPADVRIGPTLALGAPSARANVEVADYETE